MTDYKKSILVLFMLGLTNFVTAQNVFGRWKTIDDRTGNPKGIINIYEKDGLMYGFVEKILEKGKENAICHKCEGELKDKPVLGMEIISGAEKHGDGEWKGKGFSTLNKQ